MSGSFSTRFQKTEDDEASSDNDISGEQPTQEAESAVDVGPGGLSFEEGASVPSLRLFFGLGSTSVVA